MIPVMQTRFGVTGNCMQACVASILELPLEEVPDFCNIASEDTWFTQMQAWFEGHGLWYVEVRFTYEPKFPDGYYLVSGDGPRGLRHVCVARAGEIVHDPHPPHPDGSGVTNVTEYGFVVALEPWRYKRGEYEDVITRFGEEMLAKLNEHKNRGLSWKGLTTTSLMRGLTTELNELKCALAMSGNTDDVIKEAADVANYAMMIADVARRDHESRMDDLSYPEF